MAEIRKTTAQITETGKLAEGIYSIWLQPEAPEVAASAVPGQFVSVYCRDASRLLPRPISLCEIDREQGRLRLVFRVAGAGTRELSGRRVGETVEIMGPLGNGYSLRELPAEGARTVLMGGGIGIPPLLALAGALSGERTAVLGYRDSETFLRKEFGALGCRVIIATDDGSVGTRGNVIDAARAENVRGDMIFSCGPTPMQRGVKVYAAELGIPAQLSLEERMACGIGACLACVCRSTEVDGHSHVHNKRVCKDGPVFFADEIEL
ncbi:MAG: dihydroorotate dehydrogenase electron transfer subunit [Lachnospiraceae bacterium]|nr:dihydroorotate dehydrogenase electron transfer subunit [Lachnospiraceae bacterium]